MLTVLLLQSDQETRMFKPGGARYCRGLGGEVVKGE